MFENILYKLSHVQLNRLFPFIASIHCLGIIFIIIWQNEKVITYKGLNSGLNISVMLGKNYSELPKLTRGPWLSAPLLPRTMSIEEEQGSMDLLRVFTDLLRSADIEFILCDGSLLGSYIMHGFLPWDDDLDVMVNIQHIHRLKTTIRGSSLRKDYEFMNYSDNIDEYNKKELDYLNGNNNNFTRTAQTISTKTTSFNSTTTTKNDAKNETQRHHDANGVYHKFKFFRRESKPFKELPWKWPYIDVKYYKCNKTHVSNIDLPKERFDVPIQDFYPLLMRPFGYLWLPVPFHVEKYLQQKYSSFICSRSTWNHKNENSQSNITVPCHELKSYYPFVKRKNINGTIVEELYLNNRRLYSLNFQN